MQSPETDQFLKVDVAPKLAWFLEQCWDGYIGEADKNSSDSVRLHKGTGGFGGGPWQLGHLATTYSGISALAIGGSPECYSLLEKLRDPLYRFLLSRRDPETGGFRMHDKGETDIRGTYCALAAASMVSIITPELVDGVPSYIKSLESFDGGLAGEPGLEAHGGYAYCGLSALAIIGEAHKHLKLDRFAHWLTHRQMSVEGGFQGRTNKLVDSCYSFWQGASFPVLRGIMELEEYERGRNKNSSSSNSDSNSNSSLIRKPSSFADRSCPPPSFSNDNNLHRSIALQMYVFLSCQARDNEGGGLKDKCSKKPDFYHTCYSLSGLAASQHVFSDMIEGIEKASSDVLGNQEKNTLRKLDPFYNIGLDKSLALTGYFGKREWKSPTLGESGSEGRGVMFWKHKFNRSS